MFRKFLYSILKVKHKVLMTYHDLRYGTKGNKMRMYVTVSYVFLKYDEGSEALRSKVYRTRQRLQFRAGH